MKELLYSARLLVADLASTICFLVLLRLTGNVAVAVAIGMALGIAQVAVTVARKKPIAAMQLLGLILVVVFGSATLITNDPRFVMIKPSLIWGVIGVVMLKPGWMNRYLPALAVEVVPDLGVIFGYVWAGLMLVSAMLNLVCVFSLDLNVVTWAAVVSIYGIVSKLLLFLIQYTTMRYIGSRRQAAQPTQAVA